MSLFAIVLSKETGLEDVGANVVVVEVEDLLKTWFNSSNLWIVALMSSTGWLIIGIEFDTASEIVPLYSLPLYYHQRFENDS